MISRNRLGMLIAMSSLGALAAQASAEPVERPPEPTDEPSTRSDPGPRYTAPPGVAELTETDRQRIAAAQAKRERKALRLA